MANMLKIQHSNKRENEKVLCACVCQSESLKVVSWPSDQCDTVTRAGLTGSWLQDNVTMEMSHNSVTQHSQLRRGHKQKEEHVNIVNM